MRGKSPRVRWRKKRRLPKCRRRVRGNLRSVWRKRPLLRLQLLPPGSALASEAVEQSPRHLGTQASIVAGGIAQRTRGADRRGLRHAGARAAQRVALHVSGRRAAAYGVSAAIGADIFAQDSGGARTFARAT